MQTIAAMKWKLKDAWELLKLLGIGVKNWQINSI
jgi:hypothetical protein